MARFVRLPDELLPAYRERQYERFTRNLRISVLAGVFVALGFIPWARMHDESGELPTTEVGLLLSFGLLVSFALTYLPLLENRRQIISVSTYIYVLIVASVFLSIVPDGFLVGIGTFLSFTVIATILAVDLSAAIVTIMAVSYLLIPNVAMLATNTPWLTVMNSNWILASGGLVAFGLALVLDQANRNAFLLEHSLAVEKERGDALLSALLPQRIADRLRESNDVIAEVQPGATVLFADIVGFTELTRSLTPEGLINLLSSVFTVLDELAREHGLEKIKTIGDSYMVAAGVADARQRSSHDVAGFALDAIQAIDRFDEIPGLHLNLRVGMASGPVISGVIGRRKPYFDLWGTTVNLASRLVDTAPPGAIHVDAGTARLLEDSYECVSRGQTALQGIGTIESCLLVARVASESVDHSGTAEPAGLVAPTEP
jgi:class 3 adenylate cyclase